MNLIKRLLPRAIRNRYSDLKRRLDRIELTIKCLEAALDGLVVNPKYVSREDIGFNGQRHRKRIFSEVMSALQLEVVVETGTWLGDTTGYMAQTANRPVFSCEIDCRIHAVANKRLAEINDVHLELCDSRAFLRKLIREGLAKKSAFFYLDAHWYEDLPLAEEIDIIATGWNHWVAMIDDFKVPDDLGYRYDSY